MHLSLRQIDRFFDLLDQLLAFANKRLDLVEELKLPIVGEEAEMKAAYVCEMLWENREVIDEFVRVNPQGMSARDLATIEAWRDALVGDFTLVRHENGNALLMNEAGLFSVAGLDADLSERLSQAPDILHVALLPFEGIIITDGLEMGSGIPLNAEELHQMDEQYRQVEPQGVARTAEELRERATAFNRERRERDFDALLASVELEARQSREGERLPEGYHRGVLAGLSPEEREARILERLNKLQEQMSTALQTISDADVQYGAGVQDVAAASQPSESELTEEQVYEQEREIVILNCADALSQMCGLMTIKEAYEAYSAVVLDVVDIERFVSALMAEDTHGTAEFALQEWQGQSYLMHYTISDAYAREWVAQQQARNLEQKASGIRTEGEAAAALAQMVDDVARGVETELTSLEDYRKHLLECRKRTPRRPLDPQVADGAYLDTLASRPALLQLRDFLDAHVPDGEDDYSYAERAIDEIILHSIDSGDAMSFLDEIEKSGLSACAEDPGLMLRLLENAYAALPSWEYNGWSPQEILERITGRPVFYNVRGEMVRPVPSDPCPCGSGLSYGECHGA